ncbi:protein of unknown function [Chryseobacterium sp. JV274]|nr:protein of unknown function [Chryseobacterium sp. JV274]
MIKCKNISFAKAFYSARQNVYYCLVKRLCELKNSIQIKKLSDHSVKIKVLRHSFLLFTSIYEYNNKRNQPAAKR